MLKEILEKLLKGQKIKLLQDITMGHLYEWTNGGIGEEDDDTPYFEKGEVLTFKDDSFDNGYGSNVASDMLDEYNIKYKKV